MNRIILDTNFLLVPFTCNIHITSQIEKVLSGYEICVLSSSIDELHKITQVQSGLDARAAKMAIELTQKFTILPSQGHVDDKIVAYCSAHASTVVATQDKELKMRLKKIGTKIIVLRQKTHLELQEAY